MMMEVEPVTSNSTSNSNNNSETEHLNDVNLNEVDPSRLNQIISDYRRVQEAATNEIDRKRRAVRSKCDERLWMATLWRDYQLEIVKKSFEAEIKQIEREHQSEFNNLKDSMLQELQEEKKRLQILESNANLSVDKTGNLVVNSESSMTSDAMTAALIAAEEQAAVASGRRLRRRDEKEIVANGLPPTTSVSGTSVTGTTGNTTTTSASRRKQVNNIYTYNTMLQEQEILDDLGAIAKEAGSLGTSRRAAAVIKNTVNQQSSTINGNGTINVSFERGVLNYNWDIINVSDRIRIQLAPNSTAVNATVLSCSPTELIVSTGRNQIKINLTDLKSGKITILTDDQHLHDN